MKRFIAVILVIAAFASCLTLSGCTGSKQSAKEKYGMDYYTRSDGKRIWYYT